MVPNASKQAFTLIELIITVAIAATLITATLTSFRSYTRNNIALQLARQFVVDISYARNYALSTKKTVSICPSSTVAAGTSMVCAPSLQDWRAGWIIYVGIATDSDSTVRTNTIKTQQNASLVDVYSTAGSPNNSVVKRLSFSDRGLPTITLASGTQTLSSTPFTMFLIKPVGCSGNNARSVQIDQTGSVTLSAGAC